MLGTEVVCLLAFKVHDADEAVFGDQRDGQFGADSGVDGDVVLRGGDVVEEDGLAGEGDLADDSGADGEAGALDLGGVADLEPHAEFVGAVVEEKNGEDAVMDDGTDELGGADEEGLQVEGGAESFRQLRQIGDVGRFHAGIDGVKMSAGAGGVRGAVVAFELGFFRRRWGKGGHGCRIGMITQLSVVSDQWSVAAPRFIGLPGRHKSLRWSKWCA